MTATAAPLARGRLRPGDRVLFALVFCALLLAAGVVLGGCIVDCFGFGELTTGDYSGRGAVTLDAAHPIAEQRITIRINAAALPSDIPTEISLIVAPDVDSRPASSPVAQGASSPPAVRPEVTIIRDDTNTVVPATAPWSSTTSTVDPDFATIPVECPSGQACERTYRVRVAAPSLGVGEDLSASWVAKVKIAWTGISGGCGRPAGAQVSVDTEPPVLLAADQWALAPAVVRVEAGGALVARHVTVRSEGALPSAASMRISIQDTLIDDYSATNPAWRPWVRVLPDNATTPVGDAIVGRVSWGAGRQVGGALDVPILRECTPGRACQAGYWIVVQSFPAVPRVQGRDVPADPSNVGAITWSVAATATYKEAGAGAPALALELDRAPGGQHVPTIAESAAQVTLLTNKVPTALDVTFSVPERPASTNGLDPLAASAAIVHVRGSGPALVTKLEGDGAGPLTGYFNVDGAINLIAHPFDACPASGPCTASLRLVGTFNVEEYGPQADTAELSWSVELLGAPPGASIAFGAPYEVPKNGGADGLVWGLAALAAIGSLLAAAGWRRRRRRPKRTDTPPV